MAAAVAAAVAAGPARSAKNFELVLRWKAVSDTIKLTFMHGIQEVRKYGKIFWYGWIPW